MARRSSKRTSSNRREMSNRSKDPRDSRSRNSDREDFCDSTNGRGRNDLSWYTRYPNLLQAAGSFPYPYRPGMTLDLGSIQFTATNVDQREITIPGVMVLDWMPSIGKSNLATDPASIMAKEIYAKVRQVYSGSLEADAPDYVVYLMALDSIFTYIAWLKRLYRVINVWTPENYALPDYVLYGMTLTDADIQSLRTNRTQLWQLINELVLQSRKFTCPASMDIFNRHYWMSDNVYTDDMMINSQFYMFNLKAVYKYSPVNMTTGDPGPGLVMTPMPTWVRPSSGPITPTSLYEFGRGLIDALVAWDDAYTINGYLRRAYENDPQFVVDELPLDQPFNPVYVEEVLMQIENSNTIPAGSSISPTNIGSFNVSQNPLTNAVVSNPSYSIASTEASGFVKGEGWNVKPILSIRSQTPQVADNVIASRLHAAVIKTGSTTSAVSFDIVAATEIPIQWRMVLDGPASYNSYLVQQYISVDETAKMGVTEKYFSNTLRFMLDMEQFDWHPLCLVVWIGVNGTTPNEESTIVKTALLGDTHNITAITVDDLRNLHKICVYSELNAFSI